MAYSGRYNIINSNKYVGDPQRIYYRSLWERKFMKYCDLNDAILEWGSEEIIIPYIEVKPKKQTRPPKPVFKKTKKFINEVKTYSINEAKWKSAKAWCENNNMEFKILTEDHLNIRYK